MVAARPRQATPRSTCGPTACLRRRRPASWAVPNGPTRRHRARAARSPAGPLASPACSMSRRAALPAALSPSSHCARRSFCASPTPLTTARITRTEPRLPEAGSRLRTNDHRHTLVYRSSDAAEAAGIDLVAQRAAHRLQSCPTWAGGCDCAPLSPPRLVWASLTAPCPASLRLHAAARRGARPTDAMLPQLCPRYAPGEVFRVARAHTLGSGRNSGVLGRVHVAQRSISRLGPASVAAYNLPISRPDLPGLRCESLPWRQTSLTDQPGDTPAQSGRSGSSAATRAADRSRARPASTAGGAAGAGLGPA